MAKIIRLTESDLEMIVKKVIKEQSVVGAPNYGAIPGKSNPTSSASPSLLPCVPTAFKLSIKDLIKKNYNKLFLKACLGIIGRESDFGESNRYKFRNPLKTLYNALGGNASIGLAQVKPETAKQYGLDSDDLSMASGSLDITYRLLQDNYKKALKVGYTTEPSVNLKNGTGNAALDMAISGHNLGGEKITKYCKTSNPKINKPCSLAGKTIKEQDGSIELAMNRKNQEQLKQAGNSGPSITVTNQYVQNYIPNFKTERWDGVEITSHGYISEVAKRIKDYTCF
jgi:hypothetical protein